MRINDLGTPASALQPGNPNRDQTGSVLSGGSARGKLGLAPGEGGILDFVLTSDLDWASEDCITVFLEIAERFTIKPTIFVTHESPAVRRAAAAGDAELGIHPNFLRGSDHGADAGSVIDTVQALAPQAIAVRAHRYLSSPVISTLLAERGLTIDSNCWRHLV